VPQFFSPLHQGYPISVIRFSTRQDSRGSPDGSADGVG